MRANEDCAAHNRSTARIFEAVLARCYESEETRIEYKLTDRDRLQARLRFFFSLSSPCLFTFRVYELNLYLSSSLAHVGAHGITAKNEYCAHCDTNVKCNLRDIVIFAPFS